MLYIMHDYICVYIHTHVQQNWAGMEIVLIHLIVNWEYHLEDFLKVTLEHNFKTNLQSLKFLSYPTALLGETQATSNGR